MSIEVGFYKDDEGVVPFSGLPASTQKELSAFAFGGVRRYGLRKALLSVLAQEGVGLETHMLFSEHGNNAFLPGGALSIVPLEVSLDLAGSSLENVFVRCGIQEVLEAIEDLRKRFGDPPAIVNGAQPAPRSIGGYLLPTDAEFRAVSALARILDNRIDQGMAGPTEMRLWLVLLLALNGVPLMNLAVNRNYYSADSYVLTPSGEVFFLAVMPQADLGLGIMPIALQVSVEKLWSVFRVLTGSGRRDLFFKLDLTYGAFGRALLLRVGKEVDWDGQMGHRHAGHATSRVSIYTSLMRYGGMLTAGLLGRLLVPPNYYHIGDLLNRDHRQYHQVTSILGDPQETPYAPSEDELSRRLQLEDTLKLIRDGSLVRGGRPRRLPLPLRNKDSTNWETLDWVALFRETDCMVSRQKITEVIQRTLGVDKSAAALKARIVHHGLSVGGHLRAGRPLRLVPTGLMSTFVRQVRTRLLGKGSDAASRDAGLVSMGWALGCRIGEAARFRREDYSRIGTWEEVHLRGTKSVRARRDLPLSLACLGPGGEEAIRVFLESFLPDHAVPCFACPSESVKRISGRIGKELNAEFADFRGVRIADHPQREGAFTFHDLRHAAFLRMLQGAVDGHLRNGNFMVVVMKLAEGMGQNIHTSLCSYLGSAALALRWPNP